MINDMLSKTVMVLHLIVGQIKYATKSNVNKPTGIETPDFSKKSDLCSLNSRVDKLDVENLEIVPTETGRLNDVVDNIFVKNTV